MTKPGILVTGATGKTGGAVVAQLLGQGWPVRAIVRSRDARSERLDRMGAQTVVADLYDSEQLLSAMRGMHRAYYIAPFQPYMVQSAAAFACAAVEARLEAIVGISQWLASPSHPSLLTRHSWLAERLFGMLPGIAHVTINPGYFADNYLRLIDFASQLGILPNLTGDSRNAPPSNEDIARVAVAALMDPQKHAGKRYRPTGPALLSSQDMAAILSRVLGRKVRSVPLPFWLFAKAARLQGVDAFDLHSLRYYLEDHKQGAFEFCAPTDDVYQVTGTPAEDFETTARRYASLPKARRTFENGLRAWVDFMLTPLVPGYGLNRYEARHKHPTPPAPRFAMDDAGWKMEHATQVTARHVAQRAIAGASR